MTGAAREEVRLGSREPPGKATVASCAMVDRRQFLEVLARGAGVALCAPAVAACGGGPRGPGSAAAGPGAAAGRLGPAASAGPVSGGPGAAGTASAPASPAVPAVWLEEVTVADLAQAMSSGGRTARAITEGYLARIDALDRKGPTLRSVIEVNPDALAIADALDGERRAGHVRGPLHGIPVLIKDNIATADHMATTAGSLALMGARAARDSAVAARLRAAGAVLLGKANLSEWANFRSTRAVSGWSARGGQCVNPYALDRSPCGSSSGSGAAVSANLTAIAIGTETDGSIVCPSATCGVVGVKPTVGLVSRAGIVPISASQDTAGPMARTVTDAALLLTALVGAHPRDPRDPATSAPGAPGSAPDFAAALTGDLRGRRVGVARAYFGYHPELDHQVEQALHALAGHGVEIVDPAPLDAMKDLGDPELTVLLYEFKAGLNAYLADLAHSPVTSLADIIAFDRRRAGDEMPLFGQELFLKAEAKGALSDRAYRTALAACRRIARDHGIDRVMKSHRLDALAAPTNSPAWLIDPVLGDHFVGGSSTPAAVAGYPSVTVPVGFVRGLPVGMSLFGRAWSEATLLGLAHAVEQATRARKPPGFAAHADLSAPTGCPQAGCAGT